MMLPEGAKKFNQERKLREQALESSKIQELMGLASPSSSSLLSSSTTSTSATQQMLTSNRVSDVEYEEDYDEFESQYHFNEIPSMALKAEPQNEGKLNYKVPEIRDFSIDVWNGSPGLPYWGYNDSKHDE